MEQPVRSAASPEEIRRRARVIWKKEYPDSEPSECFIELLEVLWPHITPEA